MRFNLPYPPSLNRYYRTFQGRILLSREGRLYKEEVAAYALTQRLTPISGPVKLSLAVFRPQKRGDLDNTTKALLDALNGITWNDDSQIVEMHLYRGDDKADPRVIGEVQSAPTLGTSTAFSQSLLFK